MQTQRMAAGGSSSRRAGSRREWQLQEGRSLGPSRSSARDGGEGRAKGLGWFSIGLGLAQILVPGEIARLIGARDDERTRKTLQGIGFREVTSGIGILTQPRPAGWLWSRVAGDLMDLALLGKTLNTPHADRSRVAAATAAVVGVAVLDTMSALQLSNGNGQSHAGNGTHGLLSRGKRAVKAALPHAGVEVKRAITINLPPHQVYAFWHDFQNLPRFMAHLESVEVLDGRSRWRAKAPVGMTVEWEAEVVEDRPNEMIAWRSLPGTLVPNQGSVRFMPAPGGRGTEVFVELRYEPPGGAVGAAIAKLFGEEPSQQVAGDLRRLKQVLETGEVMHSDASVHRGAHPAQPSSSAGKNGNGSSVTS
ncbi:MAG TPA: SRPBCC family protein [Polyangiaceae bacterium]|nr:SRPBCC family protein [Polyangiaceae bacterium]